MVVINSLATHPSVRGRGYGGALVEFVSKTVRRSQIVEGITVTDKSHNRQTKDDVQHIYFQAIRRIRHFTIIVATENSQLRYSETPIPNGRCLLFDVPW